MTGLIIQARMGSTRLPNKMTLPFYQGQGVFTLLLKKLLTKFNPQQIVLATSNRPRDQILIDAASQFEIPHFAGSEKNVLDRFIKAAHHFKFEKIIRICADNPFFDIEHLELFMKEISNNDLDYVYYITANGKPSIKTQLGLFSEAVSLSALEKVNVKTDSPLFHEHVTNYIYENPELFRLKPIPLPAYANKENIRLTLDTQADYDLEKEIFKIYGKLSSSELLESISKDTSILQKMRTQILVNNK